MRIAPWIIGMMLSYVMYRTRSKRVKVSKSLDAIVWVLALSILLAIPLSYQPFKIDAEKNNMTVFDNALYNSCFRVGWSYALAWIIFSCQNGSGGIIRWFLSLRQWQPIARMGLSIYLVHRIYQFTLLMSQKQPVYFEFFTQLHKSWGDTFVGIILGTIVYLTFENPIFIIEGLIHKKLKTEKK
jgi:peptidoglycan/LPS O-acetylase OafA/YrhL